MYWKKLLLTISMKWQGGCVVAKQALYLFFEILLTRIQCLEAARIAGNRNKVKVDDFKFALRDDPKKLGRVEELLVLQKMIADTRNVMKYNKDHF